MGFGLCNVPATYARNVNLVLRGLNLKTVLAFLDDILVWVILFRSTLLTWQKPYPGSPSMV